MRRALLLLLLLPARIAAQADPPATSAAREALLRLHHEHRIAHLTRDAELWLRSFADTVLQVNGGNTTRATPAEFMPRASAYFDEVRFLEWEDVRPPVLLYVEGERSALRVVEKRVRVLGADTAETSIHYAWTERWHRSGDAWRLTTVVSTERPAEEGLPATAGQRFAALSILERARAWIVGSGGDADDVLRVSTTGYDAACRGPRGAYRMVVRSARDARASMVQYDERGRLSFGAGVSLEGAWSHGVPLAGDTLPAGLASGVDAHEFTLLALAPAARYRAPAAMSRQRFAGQQAEAVRFEDRLGAPAWFFYDGESGKPLGLRVADHVRNRTAPVDVVFADWSREGGLLLPSVVRITQADERFECALRERTTAWIPDTRFRGPDR